MKKNYLCRQVQSFPLAINEKTVVVRLHLQRKKTAVSNNVEIGTILLRIKGRFIGIMHRESTRTLSKTRCKADRTAAKYAKYHRVKGIEIEGVMINGERRPARRWGKKGRLTPRLSFVFNPPSKQLQ